MVRSRDVVQAEGSARTEGARRATGVRADGAAAGAGSLAPGQRWSASRKRDVVLRLLRGESLEALSREAGVEIYRLDAWRERAMAGLELGLKARHGEPVAEMLDAAKRHIGELSMEIELLRERARAAERDVVLRLLRGESLEALSREAGVEIYRLDAWRERAMAGLELGLKARHGEPVAEMLDAAKRHIGELSMEIELLRERARAAEQRLPLAMRRSRR